MLKALPAVAYAVLLYAFIFLPVLVLITFSFQESRVPVPPFDGPSLKWYQAVLGDRRLVEALFNSLAVALVSSTLSVVMGYLAAFSLARYSLPGTRLLQGLLTAPLAVSYLSDGSSQPMSQLYPNKSESVSTGM